MRIDADGGYVPQVIVAMTQSIPIEAAEDGTPGHVFRGGSTLVVDLSASEVKFREHATSGEPAAFVNLSISELKYRIRKKINSPQRKARTAAFVKDAADDPLRALFFAPNRREPFAALHSLAGEGL
jgi:hypothetical protein